MSDTLKEIARAESLAAAGDLDNAHIVADAILESDPDQPLARNVLGFVAHSEGRLHDAEREFALACALPGADDDMRANLESVRCELDDVFDELTAGIAPAAPLPAPSETDFSGTLDDLHASQFGGVVSPRLLGGLLGTDLDPRVMSRLQQLQSATSVRERAFLARFTAKFWDGTSDVFENGPLLGGSTRALAIGMLANPARKPAARLHTHDWFSSRVKLDLHPVTFPNMIRGGLITQAQYDEMMASGSFQALFDSVHAGHDYSELIVSHEAYLPGRRGDVPAHGEAVYAAPDGCSFNVVFVDGCKSWYGTKHFIRETCEQIPAGAHFIFQDYGWYTCFWLPALVGRLSDHFRLVAYVDDTYAFELVRPITRELIDERFPDTPAELGAEAFGELFTRLLHDAGARCDVHAIFALHVQHAGALASIGMTDAAKARIAPLLDRPELVRYHGLAKQALISPTYTPDGPINL
jgi:hypothetical protein